MSVLHYAAACLSAIEAEICTNVLCCDVSGSMNERSFDGRKTKLQLVMEALVTFLLILLERRPQDSVAIIGYSEYATVCCPPLNVGDCPADLADAVIQLEKLAHGGTALFPALDEALQLFAQLTPAREYGGSGTLLRCIAYSDGHDSDPASGVMVAEELKRRGVLVETLGIARKPAGVNEAFLKNVATTDQHGCHYRFLGDAAAVQGTLTHLATGTLTYER